MIAKERTLKLRWSTVSTLENVGLCVRRSKILHNLVLPGKDQWLSY